MNLIIFLLFAFVGAQNQYTYKMLLAADPQFDRVWYTDKDEKYANRIATITSSNMKGLVELGYKDIFIEGDLTEFGRKKQLDKYNKYYVNRLGSNLKGTTLGNHDVYNNYNDCIEFVSGRFNKNACSDRLVGYLSRTRKQNTYHSPKSLFQVYYAGMIKNLKTNENKRIYHILLNVNPSTRIPNYNWPLNEIPFVKRKDVYYILHFHQIDKNVNVREFIDDRDWDAWIDPSNILFISVGHNHVFNVYTRNHKNSRKNYLIIQNSALFLSQFTTVDVYLNDNDLITLDIQSRALSQNTKTNKVWKSYIIKRNVKEGKTITFEEKIYRDEGFMKWEEHGFEVSNFYNEDDTSTENTDDYDRTFETLPWYKLKSVLNAEDVDKFLNTDIKSNSTGICNYGTLSETKCINLSLSIIGKDYDKDDKLVNITINCKSLEFGAKGEEYNNEIQATIDKNEKLSIFNVYYYTLIFDAYDIDKRITYVVKIPDVFKPMNVSTDSIGFKCV